VNLIVRKSWPNGPYKLRDRDDRMTTEVEPQESSILTYIVVFQYIHRSFSTPESKN